MDLHSPWVISIVIPDFSYHPSAYDSQIYISESLFPILYIYLDVSQCVPNGTHNLPQQPALHLGSIPVNGTNIHLSSQARNREAMLNWSFLLLLIPIYLIETCNSCLVYLLNISLLHTCALFSPQSCCSHLHYISPKLLQQPLICSLDECWIPCGLYKTPIRLCHSLD